ncbi:RHS repeat-associated core domain-containing protein [Chitinophaga agrisoli]|uniref:RHS repeat-associated core domain-containing protein n=1 Tax=Chitinophaga agrisoli TaxID=2607653 RepID=A0A5B2VLY4_9BACT|nr:DUF6443 domain-containing protein [Chitinophaga agrisoli]KAA2239229.1 RHS repeat-associated core domain-containing protein [Chitinophaga agrisoli]
MKKISTVLCLLFVTGSAFAQNVPNTSTRPVATANTVPSAYTNTTINYIRAWEPSMPAADPAAVSASTDVNAVKQSTQYFDGLGRPLQTVTKAITPGARDLVAPVVYDAFGREQYKYLPYVPKTGNTNDGKFKADPFNGQKAFYQDATLAPGAAGESIYYGQTEYESSPLDRVSKTYAAGNSWAKEGGSHPVTLQYQVNTAADGVRIWDLAAGATIPTSGTNRVYTVGTLYKNIIKDERGLRVVEFKDNEGRVVMKRVEITTGAADGHTGWLCTYYVYDDLGNLRFVIPPKAVGLISASWVISQSIADELCFQYQYDGRNRMILKKVPGAATVEMVYDVRDRPVFSRDGNLKNASKWMATFYDGLNRPTMTALYNSAATRDALQASMNSATGNSQSIGYTFPGTADLVVANYDGRAEYEATNSISFVNGFESGTGEMLAEINPSANDGVTNITVTNPLPNIPASALTPLTYTFYDDYSFTGKENAVTGDFTKPQYSGSSYAEVITTTSSMTKGLVTGSKVRVLGTDQWLTTTVYYTDKGRTLQTIADNISGGKDIVTSLYDFSGKLLSTYLRHNNPRSGTTPQTTVMTQQLYDAAGRVTAIKKQMNDAGAVKTIAENSYDELGQLRTKRLGVTGASTQLETLNYEYNLRGWLKSINKAFVSTIASTANWFGQDLSYDYGYTSNQYNGNIAGIKWKSKSNGIQRSYGYSYDNANRLTAADYTQQNNGSSSWTKDQMDFSVSNLTYDANGNIITMNQMGMIGAQPPQLIDQLSYRYKISEASNRLAAVGDTKATASAKLGDFINGANTGDDYDYDVNGNLSMDLNKGISSITYNHLNLPELITVTGKGSVQYKYDATGRKLQKVVTDNLGTTPKIITTTYIDGLVYQNDTLQFLAHEEGRIRTVFKTGNPVSYVYDYFLKDHLGNVRTVLTEQTDFSMYTATMETESAAKEAALFSNTEETRTDKPAGYPQDETSPQNKSVAKLSAKEGGKKIGPSIVLRVMAGDTIQIGARTFYKSVGPGNNKPATPEDMVASLLSALGGGAAAAAEHGARQADQLSPFRNFNSNDYQRLKEKDPDQNRADKPKAYLNFALFDEQFNLVEDNSGVRQVKGEPDELQTLAVDKMVVKKSGFLYAYTSNETTQDVFFDNVTLGVASGPLLEETHYYPFGLTMAAISSNALKGMNYPENRMKYNGKELQNNEFGDGTGLEWYDYGARMYDQQIGRWHAPDPMAFKYTSVSVYSYVADNPVMLVDPDGMEIEWKKGDGVTRKDVREAKRLARAARRESSAFNKVYKDLKRSDHLHTITVTKNEPQKDGNSNSNTEAKGGNENITEKGDGTNITFDLNDRKWDLPDQSASTQQTLVLGHELGHAWEIDNGLVKAAPGEFKGNIMEFDKVNRHIDQKMEWRKGVETSASHIENIMRAQLIGGDRLRQFYQAPSWKGDRWPTVKPGFDYNNVSPGYFDLLKLRTK